MDVEDREQIWTALDFLAARARSGEPTFDEVRDFACEMHEKISRKLAPSIWHGRCFDEAIGLLRWNLTLQRSNAGATTGLTLTLSALRLATAPLEAIDPRWRVGADAAEFAQLGAALRAIKAEIA